MTASPSRLVLEDHTFVDDNALAAIHQEHEGRLATLMERLPGWKTGKEPSFFMLPHTGVELEKAQYWSQIIRGRARKMIVFGIGGSSLGAEMLVHALAGDGLPVTFYDNIDPHTLSALALVDWRETFLLVVSKSGNTAETLSQLLTTLPDLESQLGEQLVQHVAVVTENQNGALARIAVELGIAVIPHPPVGGRFSALSVVGMLPAAVAGVNLAPLIEGAAAMAARCMVPDYRENPALRMALAQYAMGLQGKSQSIFLVYGDRLARVSAWFGQLWAESLGKRTAAGRPQGLTPVDARGVTDQHSQLQLYLDGPADKQFSLIYDTSIKAMGRPIPGSRFGGLPAVAPLAGRSTGQLFTAEYQGTRDALLAREVPLRAFNLPSGDPFSLGELILQLEMETVFTATLMQIDAFDQPAVEDSKIRAREYLAREETSG